MNIDMLVALLFYGLLAIVTGVFAELSIEKKYGQLRVVFSFLTIFIPSLFAGLRFGIGTDYFSYATTFEVIKLSGDTKIDNSLVFWSINKIVAELGMEFNVVLFVTSFVTTLFIYLTLRRKKAVLSVGIGMVIYMLLYYQMSFNILRQIAAMSILLYSIHYINKKAFIKYILLIFLAMSFHLTAIIFLPLYFLNWLYGTKKYKKLKIISFISILILMINFSSILYPIVSRINSLSYYANSYLYSEREFEFGLGVFLRALPFILPGIIFWNEIKKDKDMILYFNILIIGSITLFSAYGSVNYTERIAHYFLSALIIFIPYIYKVSSHLGKLYIGRIILLIIVLLWIWDFIYLGRNGTVPYNWIF